MDIKLISLPVEISSDSDYLKTLNTCMNRYKDWVASFLKKNEGFTQFLSDADKESIVKAITIDGGIIKNCIKLYYAGKLQMLLEE